MRNSRVLCILVLVTGALMGLSVIPASAQDLCPYDVSGDYTYHPGETPNYLFFGDGQITYDESILWYLDDVLACYNTYLTPGYGIYFPKCDIDGDGSVSIGEVYDIFYRVHPVNQTDSVAQSACVEAFHSQSFFFCHPSRYDRTVIDMQTIIDQYPAAGAIRDGSGLGHEPAEVSFNQLRCTAPSAFPAGIFDTLDACYLADSTCEGPSCSVVNVDFSQAIDVYNASSEYNSIAQDIGGNCAMVPTSYTGADAPGFHYSEYELDGKFWIWDVRATAQCVGSLCDCDQRYRFYTHTDYPGSVWLMEEFNLSDASCTDPRFPSGTGCADADGDGVCDSDDQCPGVDDNLDTDGDGTPDCLDNCPNDPGKIDPGACGCGTPDVDTDGDGVLDCNDFCPGQDDTIDSDSDGTPDCVDSCPNDPEKIDPGVCGCGAADTDSDGDTVADCHDVCPGGDDRIDSDGNGTPDDCDTPSFGCSGPNVVEDAANGLCWQDPESPITNDLAGAADYCNNLMLDGYGDWRLPTISELRTIIQNCPVQEDDGACGITDSCLDRSVCDAGSCSWCDPGGDYLDDSLTANDPSHRLWSSSIDPVTANGYSVEFYTSYIRSRFTTDALDVRCVRESSGNSCPDGDGDGVCDTDDQCPGVDDNLDTDGDGTPDCMDNCPNDPGKVDPGTCGCGTPDVDTDGDAVLDCNDVCPGQDDTVDTDSDGTPDCLDNCPNDSGKIDPGTCGCGVPDVDTDGDGVLDCDDPCPDDNPDDPDGDGICGEPPATMIDDFENTTDTWPWAPWVVPIPSVFDEVSVLAAHDGAYGLALSSVAYRTDVSFGMVENEVLSMWCLANDYEGCRLGFGADSTGYFSLWFRVYNGAIQMGDTHGQADPWGGSRETLATTYVEGGIPGNVWYKMEVHVRAGGEIDGQIWAADGVTPVGSVQYNFGILPATGIAISGQLDTIQQDMGDGSCIDIDDDGSCDADDQCRGDDTTGDSDGDGVCQDLDQCIGFDLAGDADGDSYCDEYVCPANMPAFYDQSGSTNEWVAGGVCVDMYRAAGPPACEYNEWLSLQDDIALIEATFPCTVGMNTLILNPPDKLICSGLPGGGNMLSLFDDLNACWHGNSGWFLGVTGGIIAFDWNVNVWDAVNAYHQRAAIHGGYCELDAIFGTPPVGYRLTLENGWRRWEIYHESDPSCRFVVWRPATAAASPARSLRGRKSLARID